MVKSLEQEIAKVVKEEMKEKYGSSLNYTTKKIGSSLNYTTKKIGSSLNYTTPKLGSSLFYGHNDNDQSDKIGGLMMADGKKKKSTKKAGYLMMADGKKSKSRHGDGGKALAEYHVILSEIRDKHPNKSYRECQKMASNIYHKG